MVFFWKGNVTNRVSPSFPLEPRMYFSGSLYSQPTTFIESLSHSAVPGSAGHQPGSGGSLGAPGTSPARVRCRAGHQTSSLMPHLAALSGLIWISIRVPRALPWAGIGSGRWPSRIILDRRVPRALPWAGIGSGRWPSRSIPTCSSRVNGTGSIYPRFPPKHLLLPPPSFCLRPPCLRASVVNSPVFLHGEFFCVFSNSGKRPSDISPGVSPASPLPPDCRAWRYPARRDRRRCRGLPRSVPVAGPG